MDTSRMRVKYGTVFFPESGSMPEMLANHAMESDLLHRPVLERSLRLRQL